MRATKNPLVSVVIPTIPSRKELFDRAVRSVNDQTYSNLELIVVDEGLPATTQRNIGINRSHGDFVAFLDDDDIWHPMKIEKQLNLLNNCKNPFVICYSHDLRFNQDRITQPPEIITHGMVIKSFNLSSTSTYMLRKSVLTQLHLDDGYYFDESLSSAHEYDLAIRLLEYGDARCVQEVLVEQFASEGQISENWAKKIKGIISIFKKYHQEYSLIEYAKTIGFIILFLCGFLVGNRIYRIIIPIKEWYEQ